MSGTKSCGAEVWGCAKHALMERTCCQTAEVLLTEGDKARIATHTGRTDFWERKAPADPSYADQDDDPNFLAWGFHPDGTRPILRKKENGDCGFLGTAGCTLPMDVRPLICRLYPYDYTERGIHGVAGGCPAEVVPPGSTILEVVGMRRDDADRWHRMLYRELRERKRCDANRTDV